MYGWSARTVTQINLVGCQVVALMALSSDDIRKCRRSAPFEVSIGTWVLYVLVESRFQRRTGHYTRRRDIGHLMRISIKARSEGIAKII